MANRNKSTKAPNKGNRSNKSRKDYKYKDRDRKDCDRIESDEKVKGYNDPSWYVTDPSTLRAVANFPFGNPAGFDIAWTDAQSLTGTVEADSYAVPGVMAVHFVPTVGSAQTATDPINMAAQAIYTYVRSANSGAKNYEPADLMVYLLAMDNLYMVYAAMMRAYASLYTFNVMNRYMPEALVESQGFDYNAFQGRTADFKAYIDQVAIRLSKMALPSHMPYFTRHQYLSLNTFTDSTVAKAQFINYVPDVVFEYDGYADRKGGRLKAVNWGRRTQKFTLDSLRTVVDEMINRVVTDVDCGIISGDILKAFSASGLMRCPIMPADYALNPAFDQLQLLQLHNAMALGDWTVSYEQTSPDDPNEARVLKSVATTQADGICAPKSWIIDMPVDSVTPELFVEATRFVHNAVLDQQDIIAKDFGSELICKFRIYYYEHGALQTLNCLSYADYDQLSPHILQLISQVNTHPPISLLLHKDPAAPQPMGRLGQIDNYTPFQLEKMNAINNMALTAEFAVQSVDASLYNSK